MRSQPAAEDYAGLITVKIDGAADLAESRRIVFDALQPYGAEPLEWESGKATVRLHRESRDPTTSLRVLAAEQTLGAAAAIREAFRGADLTVTLACDLEPAGADPSGAEYWVRRQRMERLVEQGGGETICRREITAARALVLERLEVHLDATGAPAGTWRVVPGPTTALAVEIGRSVAPYVEGRPEGGQMRRDIATVASPTPATRIVLVLADAWVGKSHVARQLHKVLRDRRIAVWLTSFESQAPDWPDDEFLKGTKPRVWIVDAVDEAERRGVPIKRLGRDTTKRTSLTTLVFTRPDATLAEIERELGFNPDDGPADDVERQKLWLLPLDEEQSRRELADIAGAYLDDVLSAAKQFDAPLTFAELGELARRIQVGESHGQPELGAIREAVARHRCTRWRQGRPARAIGEDKLMEAARFLAAVAAFANEPNFHFGRPLAVGFAVNRILPG
ncbi:MAG: hypothetical protein ABUS79_12110, partial [Pseudomonadota bacterium]